MTQEEIKTFNELYRKFQKECERVKDVLGELPYQAGGSIYYADYFFRICDTAVDNIVFWQGYDEDGEVETGSFPAEYLSFTDAQLALVFDEKYKEYEKEQNKKRAIEKEEERNERRKLYEELKKEFES